MFRQGCHAAPRRSLLRGVLGIGFRCFFIHVQLLDLSLYICIECFFPKLLVVPDVVLLYASVCKLNNSSCKFLENAKTITIRYTLYYLYVTSNICSFVYIAVFVLSSYYKFITKLVICRTNEPHYLQGCYMSNSPTLT